MIIYKKRSAEIQDEWIDEVSVSPFSHFSKIHGNVYLTSIAAITKENLSKFDIKCIFDFSVELDYELEGIEHKKFKYFEDSEDSKMDSLFNEVANGIKPFVDNEENVVLHCFAGSSRGATMVIAYLIKHEGYSLKDAFLQTRKQRPIVRPKYAFFKQLINYEKEIRGVSSTEMIILTRHGVEIEVPDFFLSHLPELIEIEFNKAFEKKYAN